MPAARCASEPSPIDREEARAKQRDQRDADQQRGEVERPGDRRAGPGAAGRPVARARRATRQGAPPAITTIAGRRRTGRRGSPAASSRTRSPPRRSAGPTAARGGAARPAAAGATTPKPVTREQRDRGGADARDRPDGVDADDVRVRRDPSASSAASASSAGAASAGGAGERLRRAVGAGARAPGPSPGRGTPGCPAGSAATSAAARSPSLKIHSRPLSASQPGARGNAAGDVVEQGAHGPDHVGVDAVGVAAAPTAPAWGCPCRRARCPGGAR